MIRTPIAFAALAAAILAACAPKVETQPVAEALAPMAQRLPVVGDTKVWAVGDEQITRITKSVSGDVETVENSDGCSFVSAEFAPSQSWQNCEQFADGGHTYTKEGEIFPLEVGKTMSFPLKGNNVDGDSWETTRVCTVEGTARVTVPAGTFDTYHVTCNDRFTNRDHFVSPEVGTTVLFNRYRKRTNETKTWKMVSFTPGA